MEAKYVELICNDAKKALTIKRIVLNFIYISILLIYRDFFSQLIANYIVPKVFPTHPLFTITFLILISFLVIVFTLKTLLYKYNTSINETNVILLTLITLFYYNSIYTHNNWFIIQLYNSNISYFEIIYFALILLLVIILFRYLNNLGERNEIDSSSNFLLDDNPIDDFNLDKLNYEDTANKLIKILLNDNHRKSFTIGLVGPWGNGKTSVFEIVKKQMKSTREFNENEIILFDFHPYLNHHESDIINEFFITLSSNLNPYSGKLSNLIINYAAKVTELYENKNIINFLEDQVIDINKTSASELYQTIDEMLADINKKIIVFIDDLDRLNKDEIIHVLKLIRNTANFRNTFFVVAMDKSYVVRNLKKSKKIHSNNFLDKFFQLEIYLPEINKSSLRQILIKEILNSSLNNGSPNFESEIIAAVNNPRNLFDDYIHNIRDIKRFVNQITIDYPNTRGEISFKDFFNFTYFKLKFPNFITIIKDLIANNKLILKKDGIFFLSKDGDGDGKNNNSDDIFDFLELKKVNFKLENYQISKKLENKDCLDQDKIIDCHDQLLLVKTMAFLFGEENNDKNANSIRNENVLSIVLEQKIYKDRLLNNEFNDLLQADFITIKQILNNFHTQNKIEQLFSRFEYYTSEEENKLQNAILALVYIFSNKNFNVNEDLIFNQIGVFSNTLRNTIKLKDWSKNEIFNNPNFNIEARVLLASQLKNIGLGTRASQHNWDFTSDELDILTVELFEEYLKYYGNLLQKNTDLSIVNDYSLYKVYHGVKSKTKQQEINKLFKDFWAKNNLELLCAQLTTFENWTVKAFKISELVVELFGSYDDYILFIKSHNDSKEVEIQEYLSLYNILRISKFKIARVFTFTKSKSMLTKIQKAKSHNSSNYDEFENIVEVIFETNSFKLLEVINEGNVEKGYDLKFEINKEAKYIIARFKREKNANPLYNFIDFVVDSIDSSIEELRFIRFYATNFTIDQNLFIGDKNNTYLKIISIQPDKDLL